jgi:SAM-dependent methyltransferase
MKSVKVIQAMLNTSALICTFAAMQEHRVQYLTAPHLFEVQEALYLKVRKQEDWVYPDHLLLNLPEVPHTDRHYKIWRWRAASFRRLLRYLKKQYGENPIRILDIGCGNGWMSNRLAEAFAGEVWALDVNKTELEQGARVFGRPGLQFVFADIHSAVLPVQYFDVAILAGSAQYFPDFTALILSLRRIMKPDGVVHIIDTNFYRDENSREAASMATRKYYEGMGVPELAQYFHHHLMAETGGVDLNSGFGTRLKQRLKILSPFPWVRIGF